MPWSTRLGIAWRLTRPFTLTASAVPVLVGTGLAVTAGHFRLYPFLAFLLAALLIQAATNMFNEYFDYKRGLDSKEMVGIAGTIVHDGVSPRAVLICAWSFIVTSALLGLYICASSSWWIALVGTLCIGVAYLYSGGPKPLSYTPFGELAAALAMGPVIVLLVYFVEASSISLRAAIASIPVGLLIGAILMANNIRDMDLDKAGGRQTLVILLGRQAARILFTVVFVVTYLTVLGLIVLHWLTPWTLLVLLTIPSAWYVLKLFFRHTEPSSLHPAVKGTAVLLARFGALMFAAMMVSHWVR